MTNEKRVFFKELTRKKNKFRGLISIPLSLLFHFSMIGALVIFPLISAQDMPEVKNHAVHLFSMPKLTTPSIRQGSKPGPKRTPPVDKDYPKDRPENSMIAPIDIPDEIPEPDFSPIDDSNSGSDVDGGIDGDFLDTIGGWDGPGDGDGFKGTMKLPVSVIRNPRLIKRVKPVYPPLALKARRQGNVTLEAETDIYGRVNRVRVISGDPFLNDAAVKAIRQWVYEPYIINGIPQAVKFTVRITFRLNR